MSTRKTYQVFFPKHSESRCNSFYIMHSDIWGHIMSHLLVLDIVTFTHEFSRCTKICLMKDHFELLSIFMSFVMK